MSVLISFIYGIIHFIGFNLQRYYKKMEKHRFIHILTIKMNEIAKKDVTLQTESEERRTKS
jgi:hypothetical protein